MWNKQSNSLLHYTMKKIFIFSLLYVLCLMACRSGNSDSATQTTADSLPIVQSTVIPFKYYGHLYCPMIINDSVKGNFVFDTGADNLYLDTLFLFQSPLPQKQTGTVMLPGVGSSFQKTKMIRDKYNCQYGPLTLTPPYTVTMNLKPILGRYADGIIGMNFLKDSVFSIDYIKEEIRILDPKDFSTEGYEKLPISIRKNRIYIQAAIQVAPKKKIEGEFLLDLGNGGSINLTNQCARENNLAQLVPEKIRTYTNWGGIGGASSSFNFQADTFYIGNQKIVKPLADYSNDTKGALSSRDYIGLIGNGISDRFDLILNIPDSSLYLRPNKNFPLPYKQTNTGFAYVDRTDICDGWIVRALYEGLPAEKAGLQINDIIVKINDKPTKNLSIDEQRKLFKNLDSPYTLTVERSKQRLELTLEKVDLNRQ